MAHDVSGSNGRRVSALSRTISIWTVLALIAVFRVASAQELPTSNPGTVSPQRTFLNRYCITCHNEKLKTADLVLSKYDVDKPVADAEIWEKVIRKLRTGAMPPQGAPRPDKAAYDSLASYLENAIDRVSVAKPNPGRPAVHRLNRAEYTNAIRELLALDIEGEALLPADDSGYGFDNIGDVLSVSPMLLERYVSVARQISRLAIGDPTIRFSTRTYDGPKIVLQDDRQAEALPFGSRGGMAVRHNFPLDGEYVIKIHLQKNGRGLLMGIGEPHQLDVRLDGAKIKRFTVGGNSGKGGALKDVKIEEVEAGLEVRFPVKAGSHLVGVAYLDESVLPEGMLKPSQVSFQLFDRGPETGNPGVDSIVISGPYDAKGAEDTASRRRIFVCYPKSTNDEDACAKKILSTLARRAYRRPVTDPDIQTLLDFYKTGKKEKGFEAGIGMALRRMLVDAEFLFRVERDPVNVAPETAYRISDLELASRLSFFIWSSPPDDQLLDLVERGKLKDSEMLQQQVRRMLRDFRSKALVDNFAGQWLNLRSMRSVSPDPETLLNFDESLRDAFEKETELFFESMLREDRPLMDLLNANYTFVNERLARHYGIPNIYGGRFRRVTLTDEARIGLLGKGSILTVTSLPTRTSPVLRGKWVLENILGTPPPPPPPNVPDLQENKETQKMTLRQRMEQHRANPACAICHSRMDPLGFAMDNFDAIGQWRTTETAAKIPIDASGALPDGTKFQGVVELRKILASNPQQFVTVVTEKLLTYALGRGVEYYDQPAIREIMREASSRDYRWSALILGIVKSQPFQMRTPPERTASASVR